MSSVPPPNWQPSSMPAPEPSAATPSPRRVRSRLLAAAAAIAAIAGVAYVLLGSSATKLSDPVAQAATLSSSAAGYRMHMSLELSAPGAPSATAVGDGTVDLRDNLASASMALNFGSNPAATQALGGSTLKVDQIIAGTTVYLKLPDAVRSTFGAAGKPWISFDVAAIAHLPGLSSIQSNPATSDPSEILKSLRAVSSSVVAQGRQRVDGVEATLYHADLNLDQIAKALPAADQAVAQGRTLPIDVWIDASHLVRRMRMALDTAMPGGQTVNFDVTVDISDYGPQPRPTLPSPDQVQDVSSLPGG